MEEEVTFLMRIPESRRFPLALITGIVITNIALIFPMVLRESYYEIPDVFISGFMAGLVVGILNKRFLDGIFAALLSTFLGLVIGMLSLFTVAGALNFMIGALLWSLGLAALMSIPAIIGSILGTLIMKEIINRTANPKRN